jgi:diguanylate cyclase
MISSAWLFVIGGCLLGVVQLATGVFIGLWLRRRDHAAAQDAQQRLQGADLIAERLRKLTDEVSLSVGEHQAQIQCANDVLTSESKKTGESLAELVLGVIGGIVQANQRLQSKLETAEQRLQEQATEIETYIARSLTDPLTGLANRREFDDRLADRLAGWNRRGEIFSLLMIDVDHFKRLNDQYGHLAGDTMLTKLGQALRASARRDDVIARLGGEEFALIFPGATAEQAAQAVAKVRETIGNAVVVHGGTRLHVTASGGLATVLPDESADSLMGRADSALYAAKAAGRDCAFLHDGTCCRQIIASQPDRDAGFLAQPSGTETAGTAAGIVHDDGRGNTIAEPISPELAKTCDELREYVVQGAEQLCAAASD